MSREEKIIDETTEAIKQSGHTPEDIKFIGSVGSGHACTWDEFKKLAEAGDKHYYSGYGAQTLAHDLVIIFSDGTFLDRDEYDGSEGWAFHKPLEIPAETKPITTICNGNSWASLEMMNRPGGKYESL